MTPTERMLNRIYWGEVVLIFLALLVVLAWINHELHVLGKIAKMFGENYEGQNPVIHCYHRVHGLVCYGS